MNQARRWRDGARRGFTIAEVVVALAVLGMVLVLMAQLATWTLAEQARSLRRQTVHEIAANILETARSLPWEKITAEWAASQQLPERLTQEGFQLSVRLTPDTAMPGAKRVTVTIHSPGISGKHPRTDQLVAWFSPRSVPVKGGKP